MRAVMSEAKKAAHEYLIHPDGSVSCRGFSLTTAAAADVVRRFSGVSQDTKADDAATDAAAADIIGAANGVGLGIKG